MRIRNYVVPCPSSFLAFLQMEGLLKTELLFSERMKLEDDFYEWCKTALRNEDNHYDENVARFKISCCNDEMGIEDLSNGKRYVLCNTDKDDLQEIVDLMNYLYDGFIEMPRNYYYHRTKSKLLEEETTYLKNKIDLMVSDYESLKRELSSALNVIYDGDCLMDEDCLKAFERIGDLVK